MSLSAPEMFRILKTVAVEQKKELPLCPPEPKPPVPWTDFLFIVILATMSGLFSGLNLGLLGLDVKNLELLT